MPRLVPALVVSVLLSCLAACGNGSAAVAPGTPGPAPTAAITFPPTFESLTTEPAVILRGTAASAEAIAEVRVNGVLAQTTDGFSTWQATVPVQDGANPVSVSTLGADGAANNQAAAATIKKTGALFTNGAALVRKADGNLLVYDNDSGLVEVALPSGTRTVISNGTVGSGPDLPAVNDIALDAAGRIWAVTTNKLFSIDLATGVRAELQGSGDSFQIGDALGLDLLQNRAIIAKSSGDIIEMNLTTGVRSVLVAENDPVVWAGGLCLEGDNAFIAWDDVIEQANLVTGVRNILSSTSSVGSGPSLNNAEAILCLPSVQRFLVAVNNAVLGVDGATGDRITISGNGTGAGPEFTGAVALVTSGNDAYLLTRNQGLFHIDLTTGDRSRVGDLSVGTGPLPSSGDVTVDPATGTVYLLEDGGGPITALDPATGVRTEIAGTDADRITADPAGTFVYFIDGDELWALHTGSGVQSVVSDAVRGSGPAFTGLDDLAYGPAPGTLTVNDSSLGVFSVDIATGDRAIITDIGVFNGSEFGEPYGVAADATTGVVFIADNGVDGVLEIDGFSGIYGGVLSDLAGQFGVDINDATFQARDGMLYVCGEGDGTVFRVDPVTGATQEAASTTVGSGPLITGMYRLDGAPDTGVVFVPDWTGQLIAVDVATGERVSVAR